MSFSTTFLDEVSQVATLLKQQAHVIDQCVEILCTTRSVGGRVFVLGVGGSAANASHAVNDLRKIANIEAYAPTDNVAELTARINDESWLTAFRSWLITSQLSRRDTILVLSVGGGHESASQNIIAALTYASDKKAKIIGIVSRDGGFTAKVADACVIIPTLNPEHITPLAESFQAVAWHLFVNHPMLMSKQIAIIH